MFLGLANYFRCFIRNFAKIAAPLFALTRKDAKWYSLDGPAFNAFERLKNLITARPILAYPSREGKYCLTVDSCLGDAKNAGGMGACLMQQQDNGGWKPIGFASRQLLKYEKNYPPCLLYTSPSPRDS